MILFWCCSAPIKYNVVCLFFFVTPVNRTAHVDAIFANLTSVTKCLCLTLIFREMRQNNYHAVGVRFRPGWSWNLTKVEKKTENCNQPFRFLHILPFHPPILFAANMRRLSKMYANLIMTGDKLSFRIWLSPKCGQSY